MNQKTKTILNCLSCILILLFCSDQNLWSVINVYVYSYLRINDPSLQMNDINQIFFWLVFASNTGIQFGLFFAYHFGFRRTLFFGGLFSALSVLAASFCKTFVLFTITFAIGNLFFCGLIYLIAFDRSFKIFPNHKELLSGLLNVVYGVGQLSYGELSFILINPDNLSQVDDQDYYPEEVANNLPGALRVLALILACISTTATLCYCPSFYEENAKEVISEENSDQRDHLILNASSNSDQNIAPSQEEGPRSLKEAIFNIPFVTTFALVFLTGNFGTMIIGNYKPYGQTFISNDSFLTLVGTVSGLLSGLSGIVWGPIQSKIHFKYNIYAILSINAICSFLFPTISNKDALFFIFTATTIFCYGGLYTVYPIMSVSIFGQEYGTRMLGIFYQGLSIASLFQFLLLKFISDWPTIFYIYGSITVVGIILAVFAPKKREWKKKEDAIEKLFETKNKGSF